MPIEVFVEESVGGERQGPGRAALVPQLTGPHAASAFPVQQRIYSLGILGTVLLLLEIFFSLNI